MIRVEAARPLVSPDRATPDELQREEGKAELIVGKIVRLKPSGRLPSSTAFAIAIGLRVHAKRTGQGEAHPDGVGYAVPERPSGRESFSPDASDHRGPFSTAPMRFIDGPPTFAVEVRSENDYGDAAELEMESKRADYFAAGTLVVWDVDPQARTVAVFRSSDPTRPTVCRIGDKAEAEPAVPGWRMSVDDVFAP